MVPSPSLSASAGPAPELGRCAFAGLLGASLAVSMAYGVTLPLLPPLVQRLSVGADAASHTGWLTGLYTASLFVFSPLWGAVADRVDRRWVIALGLAGSSLALWLLGFVSNLWSLYAARTAAGALAAAVLPAVFAYAVGASAPERRQRRFAWIASSTAFGFLLGPGVGEALGGSSAAGDVASLGVVAIVGAMAAAVTLWLPASRSRDVGDAASPRPNERRVWRALALTAAVVLGITVAEVGTTLVSRSVAAYFALCSVTMIAVQFWAYPRLERRLGEPRTVWAAFLLMAGALAILAAAGPAWFTALAFVLAAIGVGILIPALAVRVSTAAGARQGWAMGRQAAAANLGQAVGAAATGSLFSMATPLPFLLASALLACAALATRPQGVSPATRRST